MNPLLLVDFYKTEHFRMYPENMTKLYSNLTPRKSRLKGVDSVVVFGIQHFILKYLIEQFDEKFFLKHSRNQSVLFLMSEEKKAEFLKDIKTKVIDEYKRHCNVDTKHIEDLWDLGYLPIEIKAFDEGEQNALSIKFSNCWKA